MRSPSRAPRSSTSLSERARSSRMATSTGTSTAASGRRGAAHRRRVQTISNHSCCRQPSTTRSTSSTCARTGNPDATKQWLSEACESVSETQLSALLDTNLMRATTSFKWDTYVKSRVLKRMYKYMVHFILAGVTMVLSTHTSAANAEFHENGGWGGDWTELSAAMVADVLQAALLVTNSLVLFQEYRQLRLTSSAAEYVEDWWNLCDLGGIIALYVASGAHFFQAPIVLQQVGALGVLLNAFSVLQLLKPFSWGQLGPLIKTVTEIMHDIKGYMVIIMILLTGFSVSFAVSMPDNESRSQSQKLEPEA
eukprot:COSAG04_NODE_582_length_12404_cov_81.591792_8_plen_309_part_00